MKRKLQLLMVMAFVLSVFLAACGGDSQADGEQSEKEGGDGPVNLQIAIEATGDIPAEFQKQVDRFNEQNKDEIKVKIRTFSGGDSYNQALMGQVAGGVAPDIFLLDGGHRTKTFADSDAILPLSELAEKQGLDLDNFQQSLIDAFEIDGNLYAIPKDYNTTALFYHKDIFEEAGIEPPKTWEEFKSISKELTTEDRYGFGIYPQINYFLPFVESAGAKIVTDAGIESDAFKSDEHKEALSFLETMFVEDKSAASPQMVGAGWDGEMFANKEVAMLYAGSWITGVLDESSNVGAVPLPVKNEKASMLYTAGWVISKKSEHPEAAMKLIKFLSSDEELVKGNKKGLIGLPPTESAMEKLKEEKADDPFLDVYSEVVEYGTPFGWIDPKFVDQYNKKMEVLMYKPGQMTPEEMINELAQ